MRSCKCDSAKAKEQKCEDATTKREDVMPKVRRCEGEGAILLSLLPNFALWPSHLRTFAFAFFDCIQQVSVDYIEFYTGTVLAKVFRLIHAIIGTHALGHRAYYECL